MKLSSWIAGLFLGLMVIASTMADEKLDAKKHSRKVIPLDHIWAYEMPGTRDVWELEPDKVGPKVRDLSSEERWKLREASLTYQIRSHLGMPRQGVAAPPCFAVLGTGEGALRQAHAVLVEGQEPRKTFPADSKISLVFFSKVLEYYVHLDKVEQQGHTITIEFLYEPHRITIQSAHFAIIPLDELSPGEWKVEIVRSLRQKPREVTGFVVPEKELDARVVCRPFSFTIKGDAAK